jgi:hypothetical protein
MSGHVEVSMTWKLKRKQPPTLATVEASIDVAIDALNAQAASAEQAAESFPLGCAAMGRAWRQRGVSATLLDGFEQFILQTVQSGYVSVTFSKERQCDKPRHDILALRYRTKQAGQDSQSGGMPCGFSCLTIVVHSIATKDKRNNWGSPMESTTSSPRVRQPYE